jgi:hypothetical protein
MAKKETKKTDIQKYSGGHALGQDGLTPRERIWLKVFFETLNASEAARKAYNCKNNDSAANLGHKVFYRLKERINKWLNELYLSDEVLKLKLIDLLNATEKKFFLIEKEIIESEEFPAWNPRAKGLEMAMKVTGMLKEKVEHSGSIESVRKFSVEELEAAKKAAKLIATEARSNGTGGRKKEN